MHTFTKWHGRDEKNKNKKFNGEMCSRFVSDSLRNSMATHMHTVHTGYFEEGKKAPLRKNATTTQYTHIDSRYVENCYSRAGKKYFWAPRFTVYVNIYTVVLFSTVWKIIK